MVDPHRGGGLPREGRDRLGAGGRAALVVFFAASAYLLWTEHRAHVIAFLPWGILALCPFVHLFMHRSPGGHGPVRGGDGR